MTTIDLDKLRIITPFALSMFREAMRCADRVLVPYGILNTPRRTAHFLAQILHESDGLRRNKENLNYKTPERIREVWPTRFPTVESAVPYIFNPRALANKVYNDRADLGNTEPEDGWTYVGRGLIQMTGRAMYARIGNLIDAPFLERPDAVNTVPYALVVAAEIWRIKQCNLHADVDDIAAVTKRINGGLTGLTSRKVWLEKSRTLVSDYTGE